MSWLEWKECLINLHYVKSIYLTQESWKDGAWTLNILMYDKEGKYVRHFETEKEARKEYERLKEALQAI